MVLFIVLFCWVRASESSAMVAVSGTALTFVPPVRQQPGIKMGIAFQESLLAFGVKADRLFCFP
ncbi:hypothetical protein CEB3_c25220 [Peptococcaceae bacterium CEB3]|nr:hypothetical protein CEB3_c25220 [Peptococcaceae bacterium CEB3]